MPLPKSFSTQAISQMEFEPIEEGIYDAVVKDIEYRGVVETPWGNKDQISFRFEIPEINRTIVQSVNNSWSSGGKFPPSTYFIIATALGFPKSDTAPSGEQANALIGKPIKLVIKVVPKQDGKLKNRVSDYIAVGKSKYTKPMEDEVDEAVGDEKE